MIIVLVVFALVLIVFGFSRLSANKKTANTTVKTTSEPQEIVNIESETSGNKTTFTISLNEEELKRRIKNGELNDNGKREIRLEDVAGFYGQKSTSPDGGYTVIAEDGHGTNGTWKNGHLALIQGLRLLFKTNLQRPNDAKVSNNGIVICCDWLKSEALTGKFLVFNSNGELLFGKKTTANLGNCAISPNGLYALFETYGSDTTHSDQIFIVDIIQQSITAKFDRPHAFNTAIIQEDKKYISLKDHRGFVFEIDFKGHQTNTHDYERQILLKGSIYDKMILYSARTDDQNFKDSTYLNLLEKAINDKDAGYSFGVDRIYRKIGEYHEANGELEQAIKYWEQAIALNPKVGIARKLENIKRKYTA